MSKFKKASKAADEDDALLDTVLAQNAQLRSESLYEEPSLGILEYKSDETSESTGIDGAGMILIAFSRENPALYQRFVATLQEDLSLSHNRKNFVSTLQAVADAMKRKEAYKNFDQFFSLTIKRIRIQEEELSARSPMLVSKMEAITKLVGSESILNRRAADNLIRALRDIFEFDIPQSFHPTISKGYLSAGLTYVLNLLKHPDARDALAPSFVEECKLAQIFASYVAKFGGGSWKQSPDAILLRGMVFFLRKNFAEAIHDINLAFKAKAKYHWQRPDIKDAAERVMIKARADQPPLVGNFVELDSDSCVGSRLAAGYCQHGSNLYVFGGLVHTTHTHS